MHHYRVEKLMQRKSDFKRVSPQGLFSLPLSARCPHCIFAFDVFMFLAPSSGLDLRIPCYQRQDICITLFTAGGETTLAPFFAPFSCSSDLDPRIKTTYGKNALKQLTLKADKTNLR